MTAIAAFLIDGRQVIVGDVMVSQPSDGRPVDEIILPTGSVKAEHLVNTDRLPHRFVQKIVLIGPALTLCWAGRLVFGAWAAKTLRQQFSLRSSISDCEIVSIAEELSHQCSDEDAFLVSGLDTLNGTLRTDSRNMFRVHDENLGEMLFAGSGSHHLYDAINKLGRLEGLVHPLDCYSIRAYGTNLIAVLLQQEISSGTSSAEMYGGAWEVAYVDSNKNRFAKVDEIAFSNWTINKTEDAYDLGRLSIIAQKYFGSELSIRALINRNGGVTHYYADCRPPDAPRIRRLEPNKFSFSLPNHSLALWFTNTPPPHDISYYTAFSADAEDLPFREISTDFNRVDFDMNYGLFDKLVYSDL